MTDVFGEVALVVGFVALSTALSYIMGRIGKQAATWSRAEYTWGTGIAALATIPVLLAASIALFGYDSAGLDGIFATRIVFVLTATIGLAVALCANRRVPFWPHWIVIGAYVVALGAVVVLCTVQYLIPPIEPLFPPKM